MVRSRNSSPMLSTSLAFSFPFITVYNFDLTFNIITQVTGAKPLISLWIVEPVLIICRFMPAVAFSMLSCGLLKRSVLYTHLTFLTNPLPCGSLVEREKKMVTPKSYILTKYKAYFFLSYSLHPTAESDFLCAK